jgi:Domain of unknown function (DUF4349)
MAVRKLRELLVVGVLALATLTACSGGGSSVTSDGSAGEAVGPAPAGGVASSEPAPSATGAARTVVTLRSRILTAEVTITAQDLGKVRDDVDALLAALGGSVGSEQTSNDRHGRVERSTLVLRVPVAKFDVARKALMGMGRLERSDQSARDVTTEVIDVDERVQTLQNSLDDLQRFQRGAKDVTDLLAFEEKITTRQAELHSLEAQQSYLSDQTSMSTITLNLSIPERFVPPPDALQDAGFLSGLRAGWHALADFVVVLLTVLGAVLPFLVVGLLLGVPTWLGLRSLLRRRRAPAPPLPDGP